MFIIDDIIEIGMIISLVINALDIVGKIIMAIAKALGLVEEDEKLDELGDKAIQAEEAGITPDKFETYDEYVKAVEEFEVDPEKSKEIPTGDKVKKGIELLARNAEEKYDIEPEATVGMIGVIASNPEFFNGCGSLLAAAIKENPNFVSELNGYVNGTEKNENKLADMEDNLVNMAKTKTVDPVNSDFEALKMVDGLRKN